MDCACSNLRASSLLLPCPPSSRLSLSSSFPSKLRFSRLKRSDLNKHRLAVRNAYGFDENGFSITPNKLFVQEERKPYIKEAARVNFLYDKALCQEEADRFPKPDFVATKASNWVRDPWEDCSGSGWHTYVPEEGEKVKMAKKSDSPEEEKKATTATETDSTDDSLFWGMLHMGPDD